MNTTCVLCNEQLYQSGSNVSGDWVSPGGEHNCLDENGNVTSQKHDPDLCADGTPDHEWSGGDEQVCSECGSVHENPNNVMPINAARPGAPSNPAIVERFEDLMKKRKEEAEERKSRTYRDSLGDLFPGMRIEGGAQTVQCDDCTAAFETTDQLIVHVGAAHTEEDDNVAP